MGVLGVVMAMAFLFAGVASAEMYVEGYIGGAQALDIGQNATIKEVPGGGLNNATQINHLKFTDKTDPAVLGGIKVGTWFVLEGTLGWSGYPSWAKYFGFYTDFSYQNLNMRSQRISGTTFIQNVNSAGGFQDGASFAQTNVGQISSEGMIATWAFMFAGRYGFFPDSEVPFGRLQPYVGVGPAIFFTSMKPQIATQGFGGLTNGSLQSGFSPGNQSSTNIGLAVDAGLRFMALKNVSIDVSFKYRHAQANYEFSGIDASNRNGHNGPATLKLDPTYNLFSGQVGVAYHF